MFKRESFFLFLTTTKKDRPFEKIKEHHRFDLLSFICCRYVRRKKWLVKSFDCITTAVWRIQFACKYYHFEAHSTLMYTDFAVRRINVLQHKQCHLWNLVACVHSIYNRFPLDRPFEIIDSRKDLLKMKSVWPINYV